MIIKHKLIFQLVLLYAILNLNISITKIVSANPIPIQLFYYMGGLIPNENANLSILKAEVQIDVDTSDLNFLGEMTFNGNYTLFNHGEKINISIAAPFLFPPTNNCKIIVNNTITPYILLYQSQMDMDPWKQYLVNITGIKLDEYFWLICNISISENSSLEMKYQFTTTGDIYNPKWGRYYLIYDVGTSRLWNGNITEYINMNVHGEPPNTIYYEEKCCIFDICDGRRYSWNWDNEIINVNYVGVSYYFGNDPNNDFPDLMALIAYTLILVFLIGLPILITQHIRNKKRM